MSIAVICSSYGGYDAIHRLPPQERVDEAILITDEPRDIEGWKTVVRPRPQLQPRLAAKFAKCCPHQYTQAEYVVWLDGHLEVKTTTFAAELVDELAGQEFGAFRHTHTSSLSEEVALAHVTGKYDDERMEEQVRHYLRSGHPDDWGMWMSGLIVRRMTNNVKAMGEMWLSEQLMWTVEDQLSLPYVLLLHDIKPVELEFDGWWKGDRFMLHRHADGSG